MALVIRAVSSPGSPPSAFKIYWELVACLGSSTSLILPLPGRTGPQGVVTEGFAVVISTVASWDLPGLP